MLTVQVHLHHLHYDDCNKANFVHLQNLYYDFLHTFFDDSPNFHIVDCSRWCSFPWTPLQDVVEVVRRDCTVYRSRDQNNA